ncbi:hypothetical protein BH24ACT22_BH24ACT22_21460 [soil metagenome]
MLEHSPAPVHRKDATVDTIKRTAPKLPDHELIRRDAAAHPERTPSEHEAAARRIAAKSYRRDMRDCEDAPEITYGEGV